MTAFPRHDDRREPEWKHLLREALGDVLLDVRAIEEGGEYDFLLVHPPGKHREVVDLFAAVVVKADGFPPFEIMTVEAPRSEEEQFRTYRRLDAA